MWNDPALSSLSVTPGALTFSPTTTAYAVSATPALGSVSVTANVAFPSGVTLTLNGAPYTPGSARAVTLAGPATPIVIVVTAASGARRTYTVVVTRALSQQVYAKASNPGAGDWFGFALALSADGNTLAVGAYNEDSSATGVDGNQADEGAIASGAVYLFVRSGAAWSQQAYLKASNTGAGDRFGSAVALSATGDTLVVGAFYEDSSATGVNGNQADDTATDSGAAYVFTRSGSSWAQQAYLKASNTGASDAFGGAVTISADGNTVAVGATGEDSSGAQSNNSASSAGAAYVFTRAGVSWSQQAYVKRLNPFNGHYFGKALSLSADGNTLAVGLYGFSFGRGSVSIFSRAGSSWSELASVLAFDFNDDDYFGSSVALSADGNTLAVGAPSEDSNATGVNGSSTNNSAAGSGAAYVFTRSGSSFLLQAYVKASNTGAGDGFGTSVSLSADGNLLAVGAFAEDSNATGVNGTQANEAASGSGAVYLFHRSGTSWSQNTYLKASNTGAGDAFGAEVAVSADGNTLVCGAQWEQSAAPGLNGNQADDTANQSGAVYVFVP